MKAYKRFSTAQKNSEGKFIVRVGNLYVVGDFKSYTSIAILNTDGASLGHVTIKHLQRLGNANWAKAH